MLIRKLRMHKRPHRKKLNKFLLYQCFKRTVLSVHNVKRSEGVKQTMLSQSCKSLDENIESVMKCMWIFLGSKQKVLERVTAVLKL